MLSAGKSTLVGRSIGHLFVQQTPFAHAVVAAQILTTIGSLALDSRHTTTTAMASGFFPQHQTVADAVTAKYWRYMAGWALH